jgi:hypothetical protein
VSHVRTHEAAEPWTVESRVAVNFGEWEQVDARHPAANLVPFGETRINGILSYCINIVRSDSYEDMGYECE